MKTSIMKKATSGLMALMMVSGVICPAIGVVRSSAVDYDIVSHAADNDTSNLVDIFGTSSDNNGKILADKSVQYMGDNYGAFDNYANDEFGVTLSALAQSYISVSGTTTRTEGKAHPDVVFIVDMSSSMVTNNVGTKTRAEVTTAAINNAIAQLMEADPETRIGVVAYASNFGAGFNKSSGVGSDALYLPLDTYTLPEGSTEYLFYEKNASTKSINVPDALIAVEAQANLNGYMWLYPSTGTHSTEEYTDRDRIRVDENGNYALFNADSTSQTKSGTLKSAADDNVQQNEYMVALNSKYTLLRVGNYYYVFDMTKKITSKVFVNVPEERTSFMTDGGDTFYASSLDGNEINIFIDNESSSPIVILDSENTTDSFRADDCDYYLTWNNGTSFSIRSEGVADAEADYAVVNTTRSHHVVNGIDFYVLSTDGRIEIYTSETGGTPVATVSDTDQVAEYKVYNSATDRTTTYAFKKSSNTSVNVSFSTEGYVKVTNINTTKQKVTAGDYTYWVAQVTETNNGTTRTFVAVYRNQNDTQYIARISNNGGATSDYSFDQDFTDLETGVYFSRFDRTIDKTNSASNLSNSQLIVKYPQSSSVNYESFDYTAPTYAVRSPITAEDGTTFYVENINGSFSIYKQADGGSAIASVSSDSQAYSYTENNLDIYNFRRVDSDTINVDYVEQVNVTDLVWAWQTINIGNNTYYTYRTQDEASIVIFNKAPANNQDTSGRIATITNVGASYTDSSTGVIFTKTSASEMNVKYSENTDSINYDVEASAARTPITLSSGETFYVAATDDDFKIYTQSSGGNTIATLTAASPANDYSANSKSYQFVRDAETGSLTVSSGTLTTVTETKENTEDIDTNGSSRTNKKVFSVNGVSFQAYQRTSGSIALYTSSGSSIAEIGLKQTMPYTDQATGKVFNFTKTANNTLSVTYTATTTTTTFDPETETSDTFSFVTRTPYTTSDGVTFYVTAANNGFRFYSQPSGGSPVATVSSGSTTSIGNIYGIAEYFQYVNATQFKAGNKYSTSATINNIAVQEKTTCTLGTDDIIYFLVSDGTMKIYSNPNGKPIKTLEPDQSATIVIGSNKYTVTNNNNKSLHVLYQEPVSDKTTTVNNFNNKLACTLDNGTTFYLTITGKDSNRIINVYDSADAKDPIATSENSRFTHDSVEYIVEYDGDSGATISYLSNRTGSATKAMTIPSTTPATRSGDGSLTEDKNIPYYSLGVNANLINSEGNAVGTHTAVGFEKGTYTQIGLKGAMDMLCATTDTDGRVPVIVLVSDGEPTLSHTDIHNPQITPNHGSTNGATGDDAYNTVRTAMYVKEVVDAHYAEGDALFYSIGPGVTTDLGKAVLYPSGKDNDSDVKTYLEKCENHSILSYKQFYEKVMYAAGNDPEVALDYVNYADWGIMGNLSESELMEGFQHIVDMINDIPRPITAVTIIDKETNSRAFDGKNMVFVDTIGDGMGLSCIDEDNKLIFAKAPKLLYSGDTNTAYAPTNYTSADITDNDDNVIGTKYTLTYNYTVQEVSTKLMKDLSGIDVNIYLYEDGKQKVEWKIPADLVPTIYPDASGNPDYFMRTDPIRLAYQVHLTTDETGTYYTNSTTEPATCTFVPSKGNPYYYETEVDGTDQTSSDFVYTGEKDSSGNPIEFNKNPNATGTASEYWDFETAESGGYGVVIEHLGNNGKISIKANKIAPDAVVIDFGLPVDIHVTENDGLEGTVTGISTQLLDGTTLDEQHYTETRLTGDVKTYEQDSDITLPYGTFSFTGTTVRYTPTNMLIDEEQVIYYEFTTSGNNPQKYYTTVTVIPATKIYYEDSFVTFSEGNWETTGSLISNAVQHEDRPGATDANNYGYDGTYTECETYSLGQSHKTTVSNSNKNTDSSVYAKFTFTGTAFDIISVTSNTTGTVRCQVRKVVDGAVQSTIAKDAEGRNANWIVDTYYGYEYDEDTIVVNTWKYSNGAWHRIAQETAAALPDDRVDELPDNPDEGTTVKICTKSWLAEERGTLYQIPVLKSSDLEYGTYEVTLLPIYSKLFDHTTDGLGQYDFYLDAVRIYDPAGRVYNQTSYHLEDDESGANAYSADVVASAYEADNESDPVYFELKDIVTAGDYTDNNSTGILFLDGYTTTNLGQTASEDEESGTEIYRRLGPNNEIYLQPDQSIAFIIEDENGKNVTSVQLAARIFEDAENAGEDIGTSKFTVKTVKSLSNKTVILPSESGEYETATDLYYDITDVISFANGKTGVILITNTGESTISITNLKITHHKQEAPAVTMAAPRLMMTRAGALSAIACANNDYLNSISSHTAPAVRKDEELEEYDIINSQQEDGQQGESDLGQANETDAEEQIVDTETKSESKFLTFVRNLFVRFCDTLRNLFSTVFGAYIPKIKSVFSIFN